MSGAANLKRVDMVKVECVKCRRVVRTVANWGVVGEGDLGRLGWTTDEHGKAVCDECLPTNAEGVGFAPCMPEAQCEECQVAEVVGRSLPLNAKDLETVREFSALVLSLKQSGKLVGARLSCAVQAINAVDGAVRERIRRGQ